jgi:hypothetical protein
LPGNGNGLKTGGLKTGGLKTGDSVLIAGVKSQNAQTFGT